MYRGTVIFAESVPCAYLQSREFHDTILSWAQAHGAKDIRWQEGECLRVAGVVTAVSGYIKIVKCAVSPEEFDEDGLLHIGSFKAYMGDHRIVPDPEKQIPTTLTEVFKKYLEDFFRESAATEQMQEDVWNMTLRQFCDIWDNSQKSAHQERISLSRRQLLTRPNEAICPVCAIKGGFMIVDGIVKCKFCDTNFGDIDKIPD